MIADDIRHGLLVAAGGAIGATVRFAISLGTVRALSPRVVPCATLLINLLGSLAIGYLAATLAEPPAGTRARFFWMTGVLGGFTTFSAFAFETSTMLGDGRRGLAVAYTVASAVGCVACAMLGARLGR